MAYLLHRGKPRELPAAHDPDDTIRPKDVRIVFWFDN